MVAALIECSTSDLSFVFAGQGHGYGQGQGYGYTSVDRLRFGVRVRVIGFVLELV